MTVTLSKSAWTDRFVVRLGQLLPGMPIAEVITWSAKTYVDASDLEPEQAARIFSEAIPPEEMGAPGD